MLTKNTSRIFLGKKSFVALGYINSASNQPHAAIIIKYNNLKYQFHFNVTAIDFSLLSLDFFTKKISIIDSEDLPAFISYCKTIATKAPPKYGYFYSGDYFDENGTHFGNSEVGNRMTCVGFCLSTLKGFVETDYISEEDWTFESGPVEYFEKYCEKHELDQSLVKESWRRITPGEYLTSGFYSELPISKKMIEEKYPDLKKFMEGKKIYFE